MTFLAVVVAGLTAMFCLALASFAWQDMVIGATLSSALLFVYRRALLPRPLPDASRVLHVIVFSPIFLGMLAMDILRGTWQVTVYVTGLRRLDHPGIVRIPLREHSPAGVGMVALLVTISPGSFVVDIDWDERVMLVHYIDASDPEQLREDVEKYYRLWEYKRQGPDASSAGAGTGGG